MRALALALLLAALPVAAEPQRYDVDPAHTYPSFEFPHMGISMWRGKFTKTRGTVELDRAAHTGKVDITVETSSIDFGMRVMNEAALGSDWMDAEAHPTMRYVGTIRFEGDKPVAVDGQLTLLDVVRPVELRIASFKCIPHPIFRREVCGADASGMLDRADFGMKQYTTDGQGKITLRIQVEALLRS
jgi:polyisoprenoid-binding protein YceI